MLLISQLHDGDGGALGATNKRKKARSCISRSRSSAPCIFLGVKYFEYSAQVPRRAAAGEVFTRITGRPHPAHQFIFFSFYFMMTGLHGIHILVAWSAALALATRNPRRLFQQLLHSGRPGRPLLALGRHDLDLPVPAAVPDPVTRLMSDHTTTLENTHAAAHGSKRLMHHGPKNTGRVSIL